MHRCAAGLQLFPDGMDVVPDLLRVAIADRGEADEVTSYMLVFPNGMEQVIFAGPGYDLTYEATANDLKNYVVNGSEENQLMNQFRQETYTQNPTEMKVTARRYIKDNLLSPVAIHLFEHYFVEDENVSDDEVADLLKVLKAKHPHNRYVLDIDSKELATFDDTDRQYLEGICMYVGVRYLT